MGLFGRKKVIDLSVGYKMPARKIPAKSSIADSRNSDTDFLGDMANSSSALTTTTSDNISWDNEPSSSSRTVGEFSEKKQKLAKRLLDMTDKIEDLSNQIYHLKQRIELMEKKMKISYE